MEQQSSKSEVVELMDSLRFIRDACSRIRLAQNTLSYKETLADELDDIESTALSAVGQTDYSWGKSTRSICFLVGDTVRLKSGGPAMKVTDVGDDMIQCQWDLPGAPPHVSWFHRACLDMVKPVSVLFNTAESMSKRDRLSDATKRQARSATELSDFGSGMVAEMEKAFASELVEPLSDPRPTEDEQKQETWRDRPQLL